MDHVAKAEVLRFEPEEGPMVFEFQAFTNALEISVFDAEKGEYQSADIQSQDVPKLIAFLQDHYGDW